MKISLIYLYFRRYINFEKEMPILGRISYGIKRRSVAMIVKVREKPILLEQLEALLRRLLQDHHRRRQVQDDYNKKLSGFKGELAIDYPLSFLREDQYFILHDLRLFDSIHFFQIDTLIVSKNFFLIIEVKNIAGTLIFDSESHQLVRTTEDKEEAFPNPVNQVMRHRLQLKNWLENHHFPSIPIETLVVISNERSIIKSAKQNKFPKQVIPNFMIPNKISELEKKYPTEKINEVDFILQVLLKEHIPLNQNPLKRYQIQPSDLIKGVQCPYCFGFPMKRIHGKWLCEKCDKTSLIAHLTALKDYFLLIKSTINNREARDYLIIPSNDVVKRLFHTIAFETVGINKGRKYKLSLEVLNRKLEKGNET
jgi:Nuclease-related domain